MDFIAWIPIFAVSALLSAWALWHVSRNSPSFMPKWSWAILIVFTTPLGALIYALVEVFDTGVKRDDAEGRSQGA